MPALPNLTFLRRMYCLPTSGQRLSKWVLSEAPDEFDRGEQGFQLIEWVLQHKRLNSLKSTPSTS
ncbi:hypothetical protein [Hymenobacter volaticus]|uniref:Uncharacterized protein n=1 Tax=Hymenobacter volaticus TaxID=2932254 RepID=A0ABY4GDS8_9BACT|nr:hypothetical protein [Hymenobacter volaticus]UOQ69014.1 hypothetical protein MUN86_26275 [Hymenobacter volaticus]